MDERQLNKFCIKKLPKVVRIEPSAICNLHCRHCPTGRSLLALNEKIMSLGTFSRIIEEIKKAGSVEVIVLYHGGEPFLNKNFFQMVKTVKELGIRFVKTVTNGMLIKEKDLENIINSGLDSIEFSLDGLSPEENNQIRVGGDYYKVMKIIKKLIKLKDKKGSIHPEIFIANTQIPREEIIQNNIPISPPKYIIDDLGQFRNKVRFKCVYMIKWPGFNCGDKYKLVESPQSSDRTPLNQCNHIVETITIRSNGDVVPCCYDLLNQYPIGNILNQTLEEIWNNNKYLILRKSIEERNYLPLCQNCIVLRPKLYVCKVKK